MKSKNFAKNRRNFNPNPDLRNNSNKLWTDILLYTSNLNGNWMVSKQIFYFNIVPVAEKDPVRFAKWINKIVQESGIRIKLKSEFFEAINNLSKLGEKPNKTRIRQALYQLFASGLGELSYSQKTLKNSA